ncbi:MAG: glycosyltransferase family 4 protein [Phaeodactylibacter sp.]|nr:glycosyltransferase family 4 protein [Phaeodactylibacter sp.]
MQKNKIMLYGPIVAELEGAYGGGTGGYTRKMGLYLNHFRKDDFEMIPCYHTVKGQYKYGFFVVRFFMDLWSFLRGLIQIKPKIVHIQAQYRTAVPREFAIILLARLFGKPVVYEIKAGVFHSWYPQTNPLFRWMAKFCIKNSAVVLCQGKPYIDLIEKEIGVKAYYYPNFVAMTEIPEDPGTKLTDAAMRILFVGYAYRDKGVFELIEGCNKAAEVSPIELTLIGKEHPEFTEWLDQFTLHPNFKVHRLGRMPHEEVLKQYPLHDIYCYPTRHPGEGHNNSINEAMMSGLVIVTTRQGFLGTILNNDIAYFLDAVSTEEVERTLKAIATDRPTAQEKARKVRQYLLDNFTSDVAYNKLEQHYSNILHLQTATT